MSLELALVRNGKVVFRSPIIAPGMGEVNEIESSDFQRLAEIFFLASNEGRLRLMNELMRRQETRFTELLRIVVNPKLAKDCVEPMVKAGLLVHKSKGSTYKPSPRGAIVISTLTWGLIGIIRKAGGKPFD